MLCGVRPHQIWANAGTSKISTSAWETQMGPSTIVGEVCLLGQDGCYALLLLADSSSESGLARRLSFLLLPPLFSFILLPRRVLLPACVTSDNP